MVAVWGAALAAWIAGTPEFEWLKSVLERPYEGVGVQPTESISGGQLVTAHTLKLSANDTLQLSGVFTTKLILNGVTYTAEHAVTAEYLSSQQALVLNGKLTRKDTLPMGWTFCNVSGKFMMGNDASRPGHFGMRGDLSTDCGGTPVHLELHDVATSP